MRNSFIQMLSIVILLSFIIKNGQCQISTCNTPSCISCVNGGCQACTAGFSLNDQGFCAQSCQSGYYFDPIREQCYQNPNYCLTAYYNVYENAQCTSCVTGYSIQSNNPQTAQCTSCGYGCDVCNFESWGSPSCYVCQPNLFFYAAPSASGAQQCVNSCPTGTMTSGVNCIPCSTANCASCPNFACTACLSGYSFYQNTCVASCPDGYYSSGGVCNPCPSSCRTCNNQGVCTSCNSGVINTVGYGYAQYLQGTCVSSCPANTYQGYASGNIGDAKGNQGCLPCQSVCATCTNATNCASCSGNSSLLNSTCVNSYYCGLGWYSSNNVCYKGGSCSVMNLVSSHKENRKKLGKHGKVLDSDK